MDSVEFLSKFTVEGGAPWEASPFLIRMGRFSWSVSVSGYMFVGVRQALVKPNTEAPIEKLVKYLSLQTQPGAEIEVNDLLEWAGAPVGMVPHGEVDYDFNGVLFDRVIDRRKLAWLLSHLGEQKVYVWDTTDQVGVISLGFEWDSGKGRAIIAGVGRDPDDEDIHFKVPESALDLVMGLESEGPTR